MSTPERNELRIALERADRRRRLRGALRSSLRALWVGLVVGILAAALWRVTGAGAALAVVAVSVMLSLLIGAVSGLSAPDLREAAVELDRTLGHDAALLTGYEIEEGLLGGALAAAATRDAQRVASGIGPSEIRIEPTARSRYLVIPSAVLAAIVLLPRDDGTAGRGWTTIFKPADVSASGEVALQPEGGPEGPEYDAPAADRDRVLAVLKDEADAAEREARAIENLKPPPATKSDASRRKGPTRGASGGDEEAGGSGGNEMLDELPALAGGTRGGAIDDFEEAVNGERFGEYAELVRRYFVGRSGPGL